VVVLEVLLDKEDIEMIKTICGDTIQTGHQFKEMGENPALIEIFGITNSKDYSLGIITGTIIQRFHTYYTNRHGHQMDQDDANFFGSIVREFAETIVKSLFK